MWCLADDEASVEEGMALCATNRLSGAGVDRVACSAYAVSKPYRIASCLSLQVSPGLREVSAWNAIEVMDGAGA
jgi:hypothetical protein